MLFNSVRGEGERPTLLFHGFLGSSRNLASLARRWSEKSPERKFISVDLGGHGRSPPLPKGATLKDMAESVIALMDHLQLKGVDLVGHSLGGRVAMKVAELVPDRVSALGLLDISPGPIEERSDQMRRVKEALFAAPARATREAMKTALVEHKLSGPLIEWLLMNLERDEHADMQVWRVDRRALFEFGKRSSGEDLWPVLGLNENRKITCIRGGRSPYVTDAELARYAEAGARVHTIEEAGHFIHVEAPDEVLRLLFEAFQAP